MTAPNDEEEVVVSLRLQPVLARPQGWRGRSSSFVAVGLVAFIVIGVALGAAFDNGRPASSAAAVVPSGPSVAVSPGATRRPNPTRRPQLPPLPAVEVIGGAFPTERRLVYAQGMQVLDLATGELSSPPRPYEDLLLSLGGDELVCACMVHGPPTGDVTTATVTLRFERLDTSGLVLVERDVVTFDGVVEVPDSPGFTMVAALSTDDRWLLVLTAVRRPPVWTVELHQLDATSGALVSSTALDEIPVDVEEPEPSPSASSPPAQPDGSPPDGIHVWANWLAKSPDGGYMAATIAYAEIRDDTWTGGFREWMVPLSEGQPGQAVPIAAEAQIRPNGWCVGPPEFVDAELLVQVCTSPDDRPQGYHVRRVTTDGASLDNVDLPSAPSEPWIPLSAAVDRSRRAVLTWDPVEHRLARVSMDDGAVAVQDVARSMLPESNTSNRRGYFGADPGIVLSPDGQRIYTLGFGLGPGDSGTPSGVWVFDAETLNLVDHWLPRAMLTSLGVSADGRFVYAAGANGYDVEGNQSAWPSSVTVYDAATGEIQVLYGSVSRSAWLSFRQLP
jgi:hypothetical protein